MTFAIEMKVRDYECDLQGIVNNSVYFNYLEHARHEFLLHNKVDFVALAEKGINLVVTRSEMDYKRSLKPGDAFKVKVSMVPEGRVRIAFLQQIIRLDDGALVLSAKVTGAAVSKAGKPLKPTMLAHLFSQAND